MRKSLFQIFIIISLLTSCSVNNTDNEHLSRYLFLPFENITYKKIIKLEFKKVPEDVPLYGSQFGNTYIMFEFSNDLSTVLTQYWEIGFKVQNDSVMGLESYLKKHDIELFVDSYKKEELIGKALVAFSNKYNVV